MQTNILGTEPAWVLPNMCPPTLDYRLHCTTGLPVTVVLGTNVEVTLIPKDGVPGRNVIRPKSSLTNCSCQTLNLGAAG